MHIYRLLLDLNRNRKRRNKTEKSTRYNNILKNRQPTSPPLLFNHDASERLSILPAVASYLLLQSLQNNSNLRTSRESSAAFLDLYRRERLVDSDKIRLAVDEGKRYSD
jgi:hypothetical protein